MPRPALAATMPRIVPAPMPPESVTEESMMGSISSEVAKKTASMVPTVMAPVEKSVAAAPEMPH